MRRRLTAGDRLDLVDQPLQLTVRYRKRIAAGQDHLADRVVAADVVEDL
jgi:hypothetical protein